MPGIIDDQVHFREPGLTHKGSIGTEARAAVAGGVTSFFEQANTDPQTLTIQLLRDKKRIASGTSLANYAFTLGASNNNLDELKLADEKYSAEFAGIKIFMGSSTGNMLVDKPEVLESIFKLCKIKITHCEDEGIINRNTEQQKAQYGDNIPFEMHPIIRNETACLKSSTFAVDLARKFNSRLHVYHISTTEELSLFLHELEVELKDKLVTSEVCIPHLFFSSDDYQRLGSLIKQNPAIKDPRHRKELLLALLEDILDVIATDHAPHTLEEKGRPYTTCPSGAPWVQHFVPAGLELFGENRIAKFVEKACHNPAIIFGVEKRGYLREGYYADMTLVDMNSPWKVSKENILYKCGWSAFEGHTFNTRVCATFVNGNLVYDDLQRSQTGLGTIVTQETGMALRFNR